MPVDHPAWIEHQRKRWMRHDAHRWLKPTYEPKAKPAPAPAAVDLLGALEEARREQLRLKSMLIDLRIALFRRQLVHKYSGDQPRDDHGRWTDGGVGSSRVRLAAADKPRLGRATLAAVAAEMAKRAIEAFRSENGLWDLFGHKDGTVAVTTIGEKEIFGSNSTSPRYSNEDQISAEAMRGTLIQNYPEAMSTDNVGQRPNDAIFHAETTVLLRAARENGGTLSGRELEVHVDRELCSSCREILPLVGLELGDPTVTFVGPTGLQRTMRSGRWIRMSR
jgi:hypothetical protein